MRWLPVLIACGCGSKGFAKATPEQRAEIKRLADERVAAVEREDVDRQAAIYAAAQQPLAPDGPPCATPLNPSDEYYITDRVDAIIEHTNGGARVRQARDERDREILLSTLIPHSSDQTPRRQLEYVPTIGTNWDHELTIVDDQRQNVGTPNLEGAPLGDVGTVAKGAVAGRAYLYDYKKHAVVCAGSFTAHSSDSIEVDTSSIMGGRADDREIADRAADRAQYDLDIETVRAAIAGLHAL